MIASADRLIEQAEACENLAAWHEEQAGAGGYAWRDRMGIAAREFRVVALSLYIVAQCLLDEEPDE